MLNNKIKSRFELLVEIYTDGACSGNPGPGGWSAIILIENNKNKIRISGYNKYTTNNKMELSAVLQALYLMNTLAYKNVIIYSDSTYIVNAISKGWLKKWESNGWKTKSGLEIKNKKDWKLLSKILNESNLEVKIVKVKGHSENKYNEEADKLAKKEIIKNKI